MTRWTPSYASSTRVSRCREQSYPLYVLLLNWQATQPFFSYLSLATLPPPSIATTTSAHTTTILPTVVTRNPTHNVKTTTFFNLNRTFTVGYKQGKVTLVKKNTQELSTEAMTPKDNKDLDTEDPVNDPQVKTDVTSEPSNIVRTTSRPSPISPKTTLDTSKQDHPTQTSPKLHEIRTPSTQRANEKEDESQCTPLEAYDISWPRASKGEVVSRPCKTGSGKCITVLLLLLSFC